MIEPKDTFAERVNQHLPAQVNGIADGTAGAVLAGVVFGGGGVYVLFCISDMHCD